MSDKDNLAVDENILSFEEALARLEVILKKMDNGEAALAEAMNLYKEGLDLVEICQKHLTKAQGELRVFDGAWQKEDNDEQLQ